MIQKNIGIQSVRPYNYIDEKLENLEQLKIKDEGFLLMQDINSSSEITS